MLSIQLQKIPAQQFNFVIDNQDSFDMRLRDKLENGLFADLWYQGQPVLYSVLCLNRIRLLRSAWRGFPGDLVFIDLLGNTNPTYTGFNDRFTLIYLTQDDLKQNLAIL